MSLVTGTIDGRVIHTTKGSTLMEAARGAGILIPGLCFFPELPRKDTAPEKHIYRNGMLLENEGGLQDQGRCGLCLVRIEGREEPVYACDTELEDGMTISTDTPELRERRKGKLKEKLATHPNICITCDRVPRCPPFSVCLRSAKVPDRCVSCPGYGRCELLAMADRIGMVGLTIPYDPPQWKSMADNPFFEFDPKLCVGCLRCVKLCKELRGIGALGYVVRNNVVHVGTTSPTFRESGCHFCMGCVEICPTGALVDKKQKHKSREELAEKTDEIVPCQNACPLGIDVPLYIYHISRKEYAEALEVVQDRLPFPLLCGTVCTHPCEGACRRRELDDPVAIRGLKQFLAAHAGAFPVSRRLPEKISGKGVAVVGSGPAGLTAAHLLAELGGHRVTVFEAQHEAGGMPLMGIPRFRLPRKVLDIEIERVARLGVEILTNSPVESMDVLFDQGFDAVLVATGAHGEMTLGIEGEDSGRVMGALDFLRRANLGPAIQPVDRVVVIGGGYVAVDAARTALRLGAKDVAILYRRSRKEMPADPEELSRAEAEGVKIVFLAAPVHFVDEADHLLIQCVKTRLQRTDASGRRRPIPVEGSEFGIETDLVIKAIGQYPVIPETFQLERGMKQTLKVDRTTHRTSRDGVFAAGDVVSGPRTVTEAIAMARKAALSIDRYLGGEGDLERRLKTEQIPWSSSHGDLLFRPRVANKTLPNDIRLTGLEEIEEIFQEDHAVEESHRCLRCSLRKKISQYKTI